MIGYRDYQPKKTSRVRESIEWSTTYSYNAPDRVSPRVLLIGDSICNGYQSEVRARLADSANVTFWATSKCVTDPDYFRELDFILDGSRFDLISFNNRLHSLVTDTGEWEEAYRGAVRFILAKKPDAKLSLTLCTSLNDTGKTRRARELNDIAMKIASELGLPVIDLFTPTDSLDKDAEMTDIYHFGEKERAAQPDIIASHIRERLGLNCRGIKQQLSETGPDGALR